MSGLRLHPNIGGEEPDGPARPAARDAARLWRLLFPARAEWPDPEPPAWPEAWRDARATAAFDWLPDTGLCAWWNDAASAEAARAHGLALAGADPDVALRVHDKAFAARLCEERGLAPQALRGRVVAFEPEALRDVAAFRERLRRELAGWPAAQARAAMLKPRLGTSGRGRVRVRDPDAPDWPGALPRLAAQGGALLEPWLERVADYSVQLHVARDGALTLLGTLALRCSGSGGYLGHRGEIDHRGRVGCGAPLEDRLIEAATELARAAHAEGYWGPCGVDGFAFRDGDRSVLRPAVELNARFTMGTVLLGLLHRARPWLEAALPPEPGAARTFAFDFRATAEDPALDAPGALRLDLGGAARLAFPAERSTR